MSLFLAIKDAWNALKLLVHVRMSVVIFAIQMEEQLKAQGQHEWNQLVPQHLIRKLKEELDELEKAYEDPSFHIVRRAANLANFAMFAAENYALEVIQREQEWQSK